MVYESRTIDGSPIVATGSGSGTGDAVFRTADGRVWESIHNVPSSPPTGETIRTIDGGANR